MRPPPKKGIGMEHPLSPVTVITVRTYDMTTSRLLGREAFTCHNSTQLQRNEVIKVAVTDTPYGKGTSAPMRAIIQAIIATTDLLVSGDIDR